MNIVVLLQQSPFDMSLRTSNNNNNTALIALAVFIAIIIITPYIVKKVRTGPTQNQSKNRENKLFTEMAISKGIASQTANILSTFFTFFSYKSPIVLFTSKKNFETYLHKVLELLKNKVVYQSQTETEIIKNKIYNVLSHLDDYFKDISRKNISTKELLPGKKIRIFIKDYGYFFTEVLMATESGLIVKKPDVVEDRNWKKPVTVFFWREGDAGYSFESFIEDVVDESFMKGLFIPHAQNLVRFQKRKFVRKQAKFYASFRLAEITIDVQGKRQAKLESKEYDGTIVDISAGGLSIEMSAKLQIKRIIKLTIFIGRKSLKAFAEIVRLEKKDSKFIIHCRFIKILSHDQNTIFDFVYSKTGYMARL